jgi:hypothetical protein
LHSLLWYNARGYGQRAPKGAPSFMAYIHAIAAGHLEWALYAILMLASALPKELLLILMRGFGRRGFGFGRGHGIFRLFRIFRVAGSCSCCCLLPCSDRSCS